jgi:hypothetical protein
MTDRVKDLKDAFSNSTTALEMYQAGMKLVQEESLLFINKNYTQFAKFYSLAQLRPTDTPDIRLQRLNMLMNNGPNSLERIWTRAYFTPDRIKAITEGKFDNARLRKAQERIQDMVTPEEEEMATLEEDTGKPAKPSRVIMSDDEEDVAEPIERPQIDVMQPPPETLPETAVPEPASAVQPEAPPSRGLSWWRELITAPSVAQEEEDPDAAIRLEVAIEDTINRAKLHNAEIREDQRRRQIIEEARGALERQAREAEQRERDIHHRNLDAERERVRQSLRAFREEPPVKRGFFDVVAGAMASVLERPPAPPPAPAGNAEIQGQAVSWFQPPSKRQVQEAARGAAVWMLPMLNSILPSGEHELSTGQISALKTISDEEAAFTVLHISGTATNLQTASVLRERINDLEREFKLLHFKHDSDEAAAFTKALAEHPDQKAALEAEATRVNKEKHEQMDRLIRYVKAHGVATAYHGMGKELNTNDPIAKAIYLRLGGHKKWINMYGTYQRGAKKPASLEGAPFAGYKQIEMD